MSAPGRPAAPQPPRLLVSYAPHEAAGAADAHARGAAAAPPAAGSAAGAGEATDATGASRGAQLPAGAPSPLDQLAGLSLSAGDGPSPQSGRVAPAATAASSPPPPLPPPTAPPPRRPPTAKELAELVDLNFRRHVVTSESRWVRAAELSNEGASLASRLFTADSLVVAWLRWSQASAYILQADAEAEGGSDVLDKRAWVALCSLVWPLLLDRIAKGTLLPGCLREDEVAFRVRDLQANDRAREKPEPKEFLLPSLSSCFGYETALYAATATLALLPSSLWLPADRKSAQDFVLAVLRLIPQTAAVRFQLGAENTLVARIEKDVTPQCHGAKICAAVLALWRSAAVADVLRSRGALQGGAATVVLSMPSLRPARRR